MEPGGWWVKTGTLDGQAETGGQIQKAAFDSNQKNPVAVSLKEEDASPIQRPFLYLWILGCFGQVCIWMQKLAKDLNLRPPLWCGLS